MPFYGTSNNGNFANQQAQSVHNSGPGPFGNPMPSSYGGGNMGQYVIHQESFHPAGYSMNAPVIPTRQLPPGMDLDDFGK